jgi:hypothetical protein
VRRVIELPLCSILSFAGLTPPPRLFLEDDCTFGFHLLAEILHTAFERGALRRLFTKPPRRFELLKLSAQPG